MKWIDLLKLIGGEPVFTSALLRSGRVSDAELRPQLARWKKMGRILQLRRGVYLLAPPYRKVEPHPFLVANYLRNESYISLQSALAHHGMIPEHVPVVTSVTTARPERLNTPVGTYTFNHVKQPFFFSYLQVEVSQRQFDAAPLPVPSSPTPAVSVTSVKVVCENKGKLVKIWRVIRKQKTFVAEKYEFLNIFPSPRNLARLIHKLSFTC